jgi:hypothetical protein
MPSFAISWYPELPFVGNVCGEFFHVRNELPGTICHKFVSGIYQIQLVVKQITSPIQHQQSSRSHESHMIAIAHNNTLVCVKDQTTVDHMSLRKEGLWRS